MLQNRGPKLAALPRFFIAGGLLSIAACAYAPVSQTVVTSRPPDTQPISGAVDVPRDSNRTIVQVRTYNVSPTVSVITDCTSRPSPSSNRADRVGPACTAPSC
jgi:hypothetical protein